MGIAKFGCGNVMRTPVLMFCLMASVALISATTPVLAHGDHGGGGDTTVLPPGVALVSLQYDVTSYNPISDARLTALAVAGVDGVHSLRTIAVPSLGLAYGLSKDLTIAARLPYLANSDIRETDSGLPGITPRGGVYGFGDASVTGTYRFYNDVHNGVEAAVVLGVKAPTGRTDVVDRFGAQFETEHQPGSGSWDALVGGSLARQAGLWSFGANMLYARAGAGSQDTRLGDHFRISASATYRLWSDAGISHSAMRMGGDFDGMMHHGGVNHAPEPAANSGSTKSLDLSLSLEGQWFGRQTIAGEGDGNTGGALAFLTPGVHLNIDKWSWFGNVGIPVARQLNGIQSEPRLQASTGVSVRF